MCIRTDSTANNDNQLKLPLWILMNAPPLQQPLLWLRFVVTLLVERYLFMAGPKPPMPRTDHRINDVCNNH
jgi:hypothetical protein